MSRPSLRLRYHRGTTAHTSSIYPFSVQGSFGHRGTYIGLDLLAGGGEFCWDPFEAYATGLVTNPNAWILGEPGNGKSALVKCLLWRQAAVYGDGEGGRWTAIADPKGEYSTLAEHLGLTTVKLSPGGNVTINPLAPGPAAEHEPEDKQILRRAEMCIALIGTVLERTLTQLEDATVFAAIEQLTVAPLDEPTLTDVARLIANPTEAMTERLRTNDRDLATDSSTVAYALDKLLSRSLRGMFDGRSTVPLRWDGPGVVLDLSAVPLDSDALPLVMVATAGWFQQLMACPGPQRVQILDEAWALLGNRHTAGYLQTCFKLGRNYGVANICITHRASDLVAQADDGTATNKIAAGLLADSATKVILRQAPDQLDAAVNHFGLTAPEASIIGQLTRGRALWKLGGRTAVVQHVLGPSEFEITDTDARMHGSTASGAEAA
jgi:type IV secretory pathway VirB4 component